jgi:hypothetical protein
MHSSMEEALSICRKWKDEQSAVRVVLKLSSVGGVLEGTVFSVDSNSVTILPVGSESPLSGLLTISLLLACSMNLIDPRAASTEGDREVLSKEMSFGLVLLGHKRTFWCRIVLWDHASLRQAHKRSASRHI